MRANRGRAGVDGVRIEDVERLGAAAYLEALAAELITRSQGKLAIEVHTVPPEIDNEVARLKLKSLGIEIDELTEEQKRYLNSWEVGT